MNTFVFEIIISSKGARSQRLVAREKIHEKITATASKTGSSINAVLPNRKIDFSLVNTPVNFYENGRSRVTEAIVYNILCSFANYLENRLFW